MDSERDPLLDALREEVQASGLGDLFAGQHFEVTEEQLKERATVSTSGIPDGAWDDFTYAMIKSSCAFLAQEVLRGPPQPPYRGRFLVSEVHEEWDYLLAHYDRLCVLAPRDHGKTFFFNFAYPIWKILTQPGGVGFIFSATRDQAERILLDIRNELETNPALRWLVPARRDYWGASKIRCTNGHRIYARGFGTKVRGAHPHWIVVDDGLNDETAYSETIRKKQIEYFFTAIVNMVVPGGQIIVVGTPFHQDDLYAELERNARYKFRRYQAIDEKTGQVLIPERYDAALLKAKQAEIGSIRFAREFLCVPVADDMSLFPSYLFKGEGVEQPLMKLGMPKKVWDALGVTPYMGVDFAISSSVQADYTVVWTMGVDRFQNRWLIDIQREKGMAYQAQLSMILRAARLYDPALIFIEANQMQRIFGDELIRTTDLPIKKFITGMQKNTVDKGVPSLRVLLENKKMKIPRGDLRSVELTDTWISEMRSVTYAEGKIVSVGGHDDTVMSCWICDQAIRQGGFTFSFDGDKDEKASIDQIIEEQLGGPTVTALDLGGGSADPKEEQMPKASGNLIDDTVTSGLPLMSNLVDVL